MHRPVGLTGLLPTLAAVTLSAGCAAHPSAQPRPADARPVAPVSSVGAGGPPTPSFLANPAAPPTNTGTAYRGALVAAVAFVRAALRTGPTGDWLYRTRRYTTTQLRSQALPAPPATGPTRLLSAQLATDTPSTARAAHVEIAGVVTPAAGGVNVPITAYLTLTRTPDGWLVDAVQSWT